MSFCLLLVCMAFRGVCVVANSAQFFHALVSLHFLFDFLLLQLALSFLSEWLDNHKCFITTLPVLSLSHESNFFLFPFEASLNPRLYCSATATLHWDEPWDTWYYPGHSALLLSYQYYMITSVYSSSIHSLLLHIISLWYQSVMLWDLKHEEWDV